MEEIHFNCPSCNRPLACPSGRAGEGGVCPQCAHAFRAPVSLGGGRVEMGGLTAEVPKNAELFVDRGSFKAVEPEEDLRVQREKREERKKVAKTAKKTRARLRVERIFLVGAAVVLVPLVIYYLWSSAKTEVPEAPPPIADTGAEAMRKIEAAQSVTRRFLEAKTLEDQLALSRVPARVEPLMREYYRRAGFAPMAYRRLIDRSETGGGWQFFDMSGYHYALVEMEDYSVRVMVMQETPDGHKVDWESFVMYGEMAWSDFIRDRPTTPVLMRPVMQTGDYFNYRFSDATKWACFRLNDPTFRHHVFGYVERDSEIHRELTRMLENLGSAWPVVRLQWPADAKADNQVLITDVASDRWIID